MEKRISFTVWKITKRVLRSKIQGWKRLTLCPCCKEKELDNHNWLCNNCKLHRESCHTKDTKDTVDTNVTIDTNGLKKDHL